MRNRLECSVLDLGCGRLEEPFQTDSAPPACEERVFSWRHTAALGTPGLRVSLRIFTITHAAPIAGKTRGELVAGLAEA